MQELLEKRAKNREKQRIWREKNPERSREIKRKNMRKARGQDEAYKPFIARGSITTFGVRFDSNHIIDVALCTTCHRKYLTKLYCLWCNDSNYGRGTDRTDS